MVKKWIFMVIVAISLSVGCFFESRYINNSFSTLINSIETLQIELTENRDNIGTDELVKKANNIHLEWHKKIGKLKCLVWHSGLKDIEVGLARISVYTEENDFEEAYAETASLIDYIAHYLDDFRVSTENIF